MRWIEMALSYNGLLALCLSMPKHYRQVFVQPQSRLKGPLLRLGGWLALSVSLAVGVLRNGWSFGPVEWVGMLAVAGLAIVFLLPFAPRTAALIGVTGLLSAPVILLL
ncbi:MAG: hypothetical protein OJF47_000851 [Nitrospira sp.]|nr:MAG: hypothetical protein OJF47_000851 [Nitrospira sp.]